MAVSSSTIKRLFVKAGNKCAMPKCEGPLLKGEQVLTEICHIWARRKGGARYDPTLTALEKDEFKNLILLCPTCHTLVDKDRKTFEVETLLDIKRFSMDPLKEGAKVDDDSGTAPAQQPATPEPGQHFNDIVAAYGPHTIKEPPPAGPGGRASRPASRTARPWRSGANNPKKQCQMSHGQS